MMIYRVHQLRILSVAILVTSTAVLVLVLNAPQKCVRVSVSVRQQWRPLPAKRTRVVLDAHPYDPTPLAESARFRTKIILPKSEKQGFLRPEPEKEDDDDDDEVLVEDEDNNDEDYDDFPENEIFAEGDFDYNDTQRRGSKFPDDPDFGVIGRIFHQLRNNVSTSSQEVPAMSKNFRKSLLSRRRIRNITMVNVEGVPIVEDGIFWSEELEARAPKGETDEEVQSALKKLRTLNVQRVELPTWNRCGRPKNQFVVFEDGSKACARYRAPHQYLVQGEVLSFYLSRLLGIHNVPAVSLASVLPDFQGPWSKESVKRDLASSQWEVNTTVALIQWIEDLERDKMPPMLVSSLESRVPLSDNKSSRPLILLDWKELTRLLQWSDLILFDYITGNYDRVASMQDAAEKERKPSILRETVHNLVRSKTTGGLWLIDNESGLLDSYSLLYSVVDSHFVDFHKRMLNTTCLFRRRTADRIRWLNASGRAGSILMELVKRLEPLFTTVQREKEVNWRLQQRIAEVHEHIERCRTGLS